VGKSIGKIIAKRSIKIPEPTASSKKRTRDKRKRKKISKIESFILL